MALTPPKFAPTPNHYIKICGITQTAQAHAIARMGVHALGFICVLSSPRYVDSEQIRLITYQLPPRIDRIGVFMDASFSEICATVEQSGLNGIQLHGTESPHLCHQLRERFPSIKLIKAFRLQNPEGLTQTAFYENWVDAILLDAYDPHQGGGTGKTIDWAMLEDFRPRCDWWLAGGLSPDNVQRAIAQTHPQGLDISSGVETSPGNKDLNKVQRLIDAVRAAESLVNL
ncbi:MAG: phosphoribosylanthranilate isomerase [Pseudanabaena sp. ELA607]|jgi:phosphoribosylanthranilate isomerase